MSQRTMSSLSNTHRLSEAQRERLQKKKEEEDAKNDFASRYNNALEKKQSRPSSSSSMRSTTSNAGTSARARQLQAKIKAQQRAQGVKPSKTVMPQVESPRPQPARPMSASRKQAKPAASFAPEPVSPETPQKFQNLDSSITMDDRNKEDMYVTPRNGANEEDELQVNNEWEEMYRLDAEMNQLEIEDERQKVLHSRLEYRRELDDQRQAIRDANEKAKMDKKRELEEENNLLEKWRAEKSNEEKALHEKKMRSKAEDFELLQQRRQQAEKEKKLKKDEEEEELMLLQAEIQAEKNANINRRSKSRQEMRLVIEQNTAMQQHKAALHKKELEEDDRLHHQYQEHLRQQEKKREDMLSKTHARQIQNQSLYEMHTGKSLKDKELEDEARAARHQEEYKQKALEEEAKRKNARAHDLEEQKKFLAFQLQEKQRVADEEKAANKALAAEYQRQADEYEREQKEAKINKRKKQHAEHGVLVHQIDLHKEQIRVESCAMNDTERKLNNARIQKAKEFKRSSSRVATPNTPSRRVGSIPVPHVEEDEVNRIIKETPEMKKLRSKRGL